MALVRLIRPVQEEAVGQMDQDLSHKLLRCRQQSCPTSEDPGEQRKSAQEFD